MPASPTLSSTDVAHMLAYIGVVDYLCFKTEAGIIGGIGVSGGHYTDDMKVAQAGLEAL